MFSVCRWARSTRSAKLMRCNISRSIPATSCQADCNTFTASESGDALVPIGSSGPSNVHYFGQRDLVGRFDQLVAAGRPSRARHQSGAFELQQNLHQKPRRHTVLIGDRANAHRLARPVMPGQFEHGDAGIFGLGGDLHALVCNPHSVLAVPLQRPARSSSPNITERVQGQQPMLV